MAMRVEKNPQYLLVKPSSTPRFSFKQFKEYNVKVYGIIFRSDLNLKPCKLRSL